MSLSAEMLSAYYSQYSVTFIILSVLFIQRVSKRNHLGDKAACVLPNVILLSLSFFLVIYLEYNKAMIYYIVEF